MPKQEVERGETLTNIQEKMTSLRMPGRDIEKRKGQQPCHNLSCRSGSLPTIQLLAVLWSHYSPHDQLLWKLS